MNGETGLAIVIVAAFAVGCGLWGIDFFFGAMAFFWAVIGALFVRDWWRRATHVHVTVIRELDDRRAALPGPEPDFAFLANCLWCADLSEEPGDCSCTEGCTEVEWCVARYEHTNTSIGTIPVYREDS